METFNGYFNRIHVDENLKEKTKEVISMKEKNTASVKKQGGKFILAIGMAAAIVVLVAVGYMFYQRPVSYVSLDINPSVELELNFLDRVVGTTAENSDGEALLAGLRVQNLAVDSAIKSLVQNAYEKGYVNKDGSTVISVTAVTDDEEKAKELQVKTNSGVALAMQEKKAYATLYQNTTDMATRTEAKEAGLSPGKYELIKSLEALDPETDPEQYKNAKVSEIIAKAQEIVQNKYGTGEETGNKEIDEIVGKVKKAGEDIEESKNEAAKQEQEKETEQNQNSETSQNQEQESNANQNGSEQASGEQNQNSETSQNQEQESNAYQNSFAGSNAASQAESEGPGSQTGTESQGQPSDAGSQGPSSEMGNSGAASMQSGGGR